MTDRTFNANCKIARDILAPLAVNGWTLHDADPRGENYGGAELQRENADGLFSVVGLYVDTSEPRRVWCLTRWSDDALAGVPESLDVSAPLQDNGKPDADAVRDAAYALIDTTSRDDRTRMLAHLWLRVIDAHNAEARAVWSAQPSALRAKREPVAAGDDWGMRTASADDLLGWCDDLEARVGWSVADFRAALHDYITARDGAADADMADYHAEVIARYAPEPAVAVDAEPAVAVDAEPFAHFTIDGRPLCDHSSQAYRERLAAAGDPKCSGPMSAQCASLPALAAQFPGRVALVAADCPHVVTA